MAMLNPYQQYKQQSILTANQGELALMLYNGCIKFITRAKTLILEKDINGAHNANIRAQMILEEFMNTLDMKYEISKKLMSIYEYLHRRLIDANISKDVKILDEVLGLIIQIRDTWEEAMGMAYKKQIR